MTNTIFLMLCLISGPPEIFTATGNYAPPAPDWTAEELKPVVQQRQFYLVSEAWCSNCPRAKAAFLAKGWPKENILTLDECQSRFGFRPSGIPFEFGEPQAAVKKTVSVQTVRSGRLPVVMTPWGMQDLETYEQRHIGCNCVMCVSIRAMIRGIRDSQSATITLSNFGQEPTPDHIITEMLDGLKLKSSDTFADLGCGDGRILIAAVRKSGCRAVGIEIDPAKAEEARKRVAEAGLTSRIRVVTGDAVSFDPEKFRVTVATAYLYLEVLEKLKPVFLKIGRFASPYHEIPGLFMERKGDVWFGET